ncbi:MAG: hypothetical protein ACRDP8_04800 [Actinopolymorphaceae bacterium]
MSMHGSPLAGDTFTWWNRGDGTQATLKILEAGDERTHLSRVAIGDEPRGRHGTAGPRTDDGDQQIAWQEGDLVDTVSASGDEQAIDAFIESLARVPRSRVQDLRKSLRSPPPESYLAADEKLALTGRSRKLRRVLGDHPTGRCGSRTATGEVGAARRLPVLRALARGKPSGRLLHVLRRRGQRDRRPGLGR